MNKKFYAILWLCMLCTIGYGQIIIKGKIYDAETKEPLAGVNVQLIDDLTKGAVTNASGVFEFTTDKVNPTLKISMVGYENQELVFSETASTIALKPNIQELQGIVVTGNREAALRTQTPIAISKLSPKLIDESKASQV